MASKTDIANIAVACHSGDWIDNIDSAPGRQAEAIRKMWTPTYELALASHPWKFARKAWRDQAAVPAAENPDPDMAYAFRQPADCVRVFEIRPEADFDEWENYITTSAGSLVTLIGTRRGVDIGRCTAFFNEYLGRLLALRICQPITASEAIRKRCQEEVESTFAAAASDNGRAGKVKVKVPGTTWLAARLGGAWR